MEAALEQYLVLAKNARGKSCEALITQALSNPNTFVFGELLAVVRETDVGAEYLRLLEIFAYGTYTDYLAEQSRLPELTAAQQRKLKMLTLSTMAAQEHVLSFEMLQQQLHVLTVRELENMVIDSVYAGLLEAKIDHRSKSVQVMSAFGRDLPSEKVPDLLAKLKSFAVQVDNIERLVVGQLENLSRSHEQHKLDHANFIQEKKDQEEAIKLQLQDLEASRRREAGFFGGLRTGFLRF
mmetsp:Transcript_34749/g.61147  ORF Transcript_34749/g.61147 Transcript_34749/m.61147 type:complete len:238 (+) Transcript_34749:90-803(+)